MNVDCILVLVSTPAESIVRKLTTATPKPAYSSTLLRTLRRDR